MPDYRIDIDGRLRTVEDVPEWLPLLWVLRDKLGITGPKYGCGVGACRACTCHVSDGQGGFVEFQPCVTPVKDVAKLVGEENRGRPMPSVRTIEGMAAEDGTLHPVQEAWVELDVPQCGFCQPGQIMTASALLWQKRRGNQQVTDEDIDAIENVCRCGTYGRIREAIKVAANKLDRNPNDPDVAFASTNPASDAEPLPKDAENQSGDPVSETITGLPGASAPSTPGGSRLRSDDGPSSGGDDGGSSGGLLGGLLGR